MQIGEKIKNYRKTAGLTQEQVADYLDVSTPAVNKYLFTAGVETSK